MAQATLGALKTQNSVTAAARVNHFRTFANTESQFKNWIVNFLTWCFHDNMYFYMVVLGRRKNLTFLWASLGKITFFDLGESSADFVFVLKSKLYFRQGLTSFVGLSLLLGKPSSSSSILADCPAMSFSAWLSLKYLFSLFCVLK